MPQERITVSNAVVTLGCLSEYKGSLYITIRFVFACSKSFYKSSFLNNNNKINGSNDQG